MDIILLIILMMLIEAIQFLGAARPDYGLSLGQKPNAINKSRIRGAEKASILR